MDFKQIQELIKMINKSNIGELTVEQKDFRLSIKQKEEHVTQVVASPMQSVPVYSAPPQPFAPTAANQISDSRRQAKRPKPQTGDLITIKSPMIGTFYRRLSPDKPNLLISAPN